VTAFGAAMLAYGLSFVLLAVSRGGAAIPGYFCAYFALSRPLIVPGFFEQGTVEAIAILISGWINVVFLAAMAVAGEAGTGERS
jgi:hypothetical protein